MKTAIKSICALLLLLLLTINADFVLAQTPPNTTDGINCKIKTSFCLGDNIAVGFLNVSGASARAPFLANLHVQIISINLIDNSKHSTPLTGFTVDLLDCGGSGAQTSFFVNPVAPANFISVAKLNGKVLCIRGIIPNTVISGSGDTIRASVTITDPATNTSKNYNIISSPFSVTSAIPSVLTTTINSLNNCAGNTIAVAYASNTCASFNTFNAFLVQLSNATGSFANPVTIGDQASTAVSGIINCTLPADAVAGSGYRIRVISSNPYLIGTDNGTNITISTPSTAATSITSSAGTSIIPGTPTTLTLQGGTIGSGAWNWYSGECGVERGGILLGSGTFITVSPSLPTTYHVRAEGCNTTACVSITINVSDPCGGVASEQNSIIQLTSPEKQAIVPDLNSLSWTINNANVPPLVAPVTQYTYHFKIAPEIIDPVTGLLKPDWDHVFGYSNTVASIPAAGSELIKNYVTAKAYDQTFYWKVGIQYQPLAGLIQPIIWSEERKFVLQHSTVSSPSEAYLSSAAHTNNINWVYGVSFLDDDKTTEGIAYIDGLGKSRQVQSKLNSENKIMAVEAVYSQEGGGAVMTLPAPLSSNTFGYAHRFFDVGSAGSFKDFSTTDFDREIKGVLANTLKTPTAVDPTSDLGLYYGSANTDSYVDDAQGYPYSYNVGYKSPLQRPQFTAGGVGATFKMTGGKEYKHIYDKPTQAELNRIYGVNDAPRDTNISRSITFDPNGIGYVTYKDNEGKVIATALTACNANSLTPLTAEDEDPIGMAPFGVEVNPLANSRMNPTSLTNTAGSKFFVPCGAIPITINYSLDLNNFTVDGMPCQTCNYDVDVKIVNESTGEVVLNESRVLIPSAGVCSGVPDRVLILTDRILNLDGPTNYIINRSVKPHVDAVTGKSVVDDAATAYAGFMKTNAVSLKTQFTNEYYKRSDYFILRQELSKADAPAYLAPKNCYNVSLFAGSGNVSNTDGYLNTADFNRPRGITRDPSGNFYVANSGRHDIRKINTDGTVYTLAGDECATGGFLDGIGTNAEFNNPYDVVYTANPLHPDAGNLYVADRDNSAIRVVNIKTAAVTTFAGSINGINQPEGLGTDKLGNVYVANAGNGKIYKIDLVGNFTQIASIHAFLSPSDVAVDKNGIIYVSERGGNVIDKIDLAGNVSVFAGSGIAGSSDGNGTAASFNALGSIGIDKDGRLYVSDGGNNTIRLIDVNGNVTTIAGTAGAFSAGNVNAQGAAAKFNSPAGLYTDASGNSYLADEMNNRIRRINRVKCATELDPCIGNNCKTYRTYADKVSINDVSQDTYTKQIVDLDGDANNDAIANDEKYLAINITYSSDLNSASPEWINFVSAFQRMHHKTPFITKIEKYIVNSDVLSATVMNSINDNKTLNAGDVQPYSLLKVSYTKETCVCTPEDVAPLDCNTQCDEQKLAYQAEAEAAFNTLATSTNTYEDAGGTASYTLQELERKFYPISSFWINKLSDEDVILFNDYESKQIAFEQFNVSDCLTLCGPPTATPDVCETCKPSYSGCVFENMDELTNGRQYLIDKWDDANSNPGLLFPYTSAGDLIDANGVPNSDELGSLGSNLLHFLYNNFSSPYIKIRDNWDLQGGGICATCQAPALTSPATCTAAPDRDVSQFFTMYLIPVGVNSTSLLDMANSKCLSEYTLCLGINGDAASQKSSFCLQNKNNCIAGLNPLSPTYAADLASCDTYDNCIGAGYAAEMAKYQDLKVREVLNRLYHDNGHLVDSVAIIVLPLVVNKSLTELETYLFDYESQQECQISCSNTFNIEYKQWYENKLATGAKSLHDKYISQCNGKMNESLSITYSQSIYHYTLYNYDFGNNLVSTVPPEGIDYIDLEATPNRVPEHRMKSTYVSGSLYTTSATSPDEGTTRYLYDKAGRVRFSQNAEQAARVITENKNIFSYTKYDNEGRVIEAGEYKSMGLHPEVDLWSGSTCEGLVIPHVSCKVDNMSWPSTTSNTFDETYIAYDAPSLLSNVLGTMYNQTYLEGRVAKTYNSEGATHYSYDAHGRVKFSVQEINALSGSPVPLTEGVGGGKYKTVDYLYTDLTSRVDQIIYQKGNVQEEFRQKYTYDADYRLIKTEVSRDGGLSWMDAAGYEYYTHGPLKNTKLGNNVQDIDLVYNINGWLKAINNPISSGQWANERGEEGGGNFSKDVFSEVINYYKGDFQRGSLGLDASALSSPISTSHLGVFAKDLFNGNISSTITNTAFNLTAMNTTPNILAQGFQYDYLNRLKESYAEVQAENFNSFSFKNEGTETDEYGVKLTYDANGNIESFIRNSMNVGIKMDDMSYKYAQTNAAGKKLTNKLAHVNDAAGDLTGIADIIDQGVYDANNTATHNYKYDAKGRITSDVASGISNIEWTVYDKVKKITHTAISNLGTIEFTYNSKQQRLTKKVIPPTANSDETTFYSYDASGILMATYSYKYNNGHYGYYLNDQEMYGLSRIGTYAVNEEITNTPSPATNTHSLLRFELSDHLGSVRAVVGGKTPTASLKFDGGYVSIPHNNAYDIGTGDFTVETWMKTASLQPGTYPVLFSNVDYYAYSYPNYYYSGQGISLYMDGSTGFVYGGTTMNGVGNSVNLADNNWHHIALIKSGWQLYLYIDDVLSQDFWGGDPAEDLTSTKGIMLGQDVEMEFNNYSYFKGEMYDTRFWKVARTQVQINANKNVILNVSSEPNLIGNWLLNEGTGDIANDRAYPQINVHNNGKLINTKSVKIPHHNNYNLGTGDFTIETKIKVGQLHGNNTQTIFSSQSNNLGVSIVMLSDGRVFAGFGNQLFGNAPSLANNTTYRISLTKSAIGLKLYINGSSPTMPITSTVNYSIAGDIEIGQGGGNDFFEGTITDTRIWNLARTPAEIMATRNSTLSGNEPGLIGNWLLNETSGTIAYDHTSLHNNGTIFTNVMTWQKNATFTSPPINIISLSDYDPGGMMLQGRYLTPTSARFGYQGSERDQEYLGGNAYTTEHRMLDVRLNRWFIPDPITHPWESSYSSMNNNPIAFVDPLGLEGEKTKVEGVGGKGTEENPVNLNEVVICATCSDVSSLPSGATGGNSGSAYQEMPEVQAQQVTSSFSMVPIDFGGNSPNKFLKDAQSVVPKSSQKGTIATNGTKEGGSSTAIATQNANNDVVIWEGDYLSNGLVRPPLPLNPSKKGSENKTIQKEITAKADNQGKSENKTKDFVDKTSAAGGATAALKEGLIEFAKKSGDIGREGEIYLKGVKLLGKFTGTVGTGIALYDYIEHPTTGGFIKVTTNAALTILRVNPVTGVIIGILDATGVTDKIYNQTGSVIDNLTK